MADGIVTVFRYQAPPDRGGPLFVKAGAIIPTWPGMDFVGQRPITTVGLEIFPGGASEFTLYEDDGVTPAYLDGALATTHITCESTSEAVTITVGARQGQYEGMPEGREWESCVHLASAPTGVTVNGESVAPGDGGWSYDEAAKVLRLRAAEARPRALVIRAVSQN